MKEAEAQNQKLYGVSESFQSLTRSQGPFKRGFPCHVSGKRTCTDTNNFNKINLY